MRYTPRRIGVALIVLFIIVTIPFFLTRVATGSLLDREKRLDPTVFAKLEAAHHFDRSLTSPGGSSPNSAIHRFYEF